MEISFTNIINVKPVGMISSNVSYGIGLLTSFALAICHLLGTPCDMYDRKIEMAKTAAAQKLIDKARGLGATGIMNVQFQVYGTTVFMYGIAYIY